MVGTRFEHRYLETIFQTNSAETVLATNQEGSCQLKPLQGGLGFKITPQVETASLDKVA